MAIGTSSLDQASHPKGKGIQEGNYRFNIIGRVERVGDGQRPTASIQFPCQGTDRARADQNDQRPTSVRARSSPTTATAEFRSRTLRAGKRDKFSPARRSVSDFKRLKANEHGELRKIQISAEGRSAQ
jgi:hypothetical protein